MNANLPDICGWNKVSEIGDNVFVPAVFMGTCQFRCPYCMNSKLVDGNLGPRVNLEDVKKFVEENKCEWVMISGGEPTCTSLDQLVSLLDEIKSWGCKIGMSTNGGRYDTLFAIIKKLNYVALDIKCATEEDYAKISGVSKAYEQVYLSRNLLKASKLIRDDFDYELRTTLFPACINEAALKVIGRDFIDQGNKWVLQQFRHAANMLDQTCLDIPPYDEACAKFLLGVAKEYCDNVSLRYV